MSCFRQNKMGTSEGAALLETQKTQSSSNSLRKCFLEKVHENLTMRTLSAEKISQGENIFLKTNGTLFAGFNF